MRFQVGDAVEWRSQSQGMDYCKRGTVLTVIGAGWHLGEVLLTVDLGKYNAEKLGGTRFITRSRDHTSYLIEVPSTLKGSNHRPRLFWPLVKHLQKVD